MLPANKRSRSKVLADEGGNSTPICLRRCQHDSCMIVSLLGTTGVEYFSQAYQKDPLQRKLTTKIES